MAYDAYGSDDARTLRELPDPKVGPGEVRIRVRRAGVNPVDWKVMSGGLGGLMDAVSPAGTSLALSSPSASTPRSSRLGKRSWHTRARTSSMVAPSPSS